MSAARSTPFTQEANMTRRRSALVRKIECADDAHAVIREAVISFLVVAVLLALIGALFQGGFLVDAVLFAGLAAWLRYTRSRVAAVLLLGLCSIVLVTTTLTALGLAQLGGTNSVLAVIVFWTAVRAVEATFKLHGRFRDPRPGPAAQSNAP